MLPLAGMVKLLGRFPLSVERGAGKLDNRSATCGRSTVSDLPVNRYFPSSESNESGRTKSREGRFTGDRRRSSAFVGQEDPEKR